MAVSTCLRHRQIVVDDEASKRRVERFHKIMRDHKVVFVFESVNDLVEEDALPLGGIQALKDEERLRRRVTKPVGTHGLRLVIRDMAHEAHTPGLFSDEKLPWEVLLPAKHLETPLVWDKDRG
jgi:hypothetical protein